MPTSAQCGFSSVSGAAGSDLLVIHGPTLSVFVGFDPDYEPGPGLIPAIAQGTAFQALVDTGAGESCIDSLLAAKLGLPIVDRMTVAGISGPEEVNVHLAQIHVPALTVTIYGRFAGVHLAKGGQMHEALLGRTFLQDFTMVYEGGTGAVTITHNEPASQAPPKPTASTGPTTSA